MKTNYLPAILISLTVIVGMNLWAIERDQKMFQVVCEGRGLYCE